MWTGRSQGRTIELYLHFYIIGYRTVFNHLLLCEAAGRFAVVAAGW